MGEGINQAQNLGLGAGMIGLMILLIIWSSAWKAIALWKAARNRSKVWYVVMFIVNTVGILEIIYIFAIAKKMEVAKANGSSVPMPQK